MLSLAVLLVLIDRSRLCVGTGFDILLSFHHHPIYNTHYKTITHTVTLISLLSAHKYRYTSPHEMWSAQEMCESLAFYAHSGKPEARIGIGIDFDICP